MKKHSPGCQCCGCVVENNAETFDTTVPPHPDSRPNLEVLQGTLIERLDLGFDQTETSDDDLFVICNAEYGNGGAFAKLVFESNNRDRVRLFLDVVDQDNCHFVERFHDECPQIAIYKRTAGVDTLLYKFGTGVQIAADASPTVLTSAQIFACIDGDYIMAGSGGNNWNGHEHIWYPITPHGGKKSGFGTDAAQDKIRFQRFMITERQSGDFYNSSDECPECAKKACLRCLSSGLGWQVRIKVKRQAGFFLCPETAHTFVLDYRCLEPGNSGCSWELMDDTTFPCSWLRVTALLINDGTKTHLYFRAFNASNVMEAHAYFLVGNTISGDTTSDISCPSGVMSLATTGSEGTVNSSEVWQTNQCEAEFL